MFGGCDGHTQREQYDKTPKIPLIIGLSALLLVIMTIIWLVVYRKIRRRQRRRTIGVCNFPSIIYPISQIIYFKFKKKIEYLLYHLTYIETGDGSPIRQDFTQLG